jgi:reactive intermediate/imine deaminase
MRSLVVVAALAVGAIAHAVAQERQVIQLPGAPEGLPFSTAVRVGNLIFLSGQIGIVPGRRTVVPGGISAEARQTLENIKHTLEQIGSSMDRVVKCTVFLADMADYSAMNDVYRTFFPTDPPARSTVAGSGLALNARVEIECIATT